MDYILCSSLCVLLSCLVSLLSASRCPGTDWYFRKGTNQCYYIYDPTRSSQDGGDGALQTWTETIEECKIRGGKLAVFDDPGELEWIKAKLVSRTYWYWFGLTYENLTWQWYDGYDYKPFRPISGLDVTTPTGLYANEKRGTLKYNAVPDSSGFGFREDSATTYNRNAYICKADWTAKPWCKTEEQWKYYEGRCYKEFTAPENFFLAGAQCFADGGQLPVLKTSSIDDVMKRWVREDLKVTTTWIGISIMQKNATTDANNVMWTDGTRMNETRVSATSGWPTKDLDSYIRGLANDKDYCGELFSTKSGSSDDYGVYKLDKHEWRLRSNCFDEKPYICETPLNKCPYGWHQLDDDCYEINLGQDSLKSWSAASLNCQQKMGNLVVINRSNQPEVNPDETFSFSN